MKVRRSKHRDNRCTYILKTYAGVRIFKYYNKGKYSRALNRRGELNSE